MWVQEGFDCKDNDDAVIGNSSLFSGIFSLSRSRSNQSVTQIAIPMNPPSQMTENKMENGNKSDIESDEKDKDETPISPVPIKDMPKPITPAKFLENMGRHDNDEENSAKFDIPSRPIFKLETSDDETKEMKEMKEIESDEFDETSNKDEIEWDNYMPKIFNGLDIEKEFEWEGCIQYTKQNKALLIIEVYSKVFGPSNVMYPFIDDILHKKKQKNKNVKFIRLRVHKINEIKQIKQIVNEHFSTPIPTYIFVKNGIKIDELKGTQPQQFEQLIDKYLKNKLIRPQSAPVKYTSILARSNSDINQSQTTK